MRLMSSTQNYNRGFTILEMMVTLSIMMCVSGILVSSFKTILYSLRKDYIRTSLNQNLRTSADIMGASIRIGGGNLSNNFPAFILTNGSGTAADQITVRRSVISEVLPVCTTVNSATTTDRIFFANTGSTQGCSHTSNLSIYNAWRTYRLNNGNTVKAYIFNMSTKYGEFINYTGEANLGTSLYITRGSGALTGSYPAGASTVYLLEDWKYIIEDNTLKLVEYNDSSTKKNINFNTKNIQVYFVLNDGTVRESFGVNDDWSKISAVSTTIYGSENYRDTTVEKKITTSFFPRNVLSFMR